MNERTNEQMNELPNQFLKKNYGTFRNADSEHFTWQEGRKPDPGYGLGSSPCSVTAWSLPSAQHTPPGPQFHPL